MVKKIKDVSHYIVVFYCLIFIACQEDDTISCNENQGLSGSLYNETALTDFPVCGTFELQVNPDIMANVNGENRVIGKKYIFENEGVAFESVYYVRGEIAIYTKDSSDYDSKDFSFEFSQLAIPQTDTFEDGNIVVQMIFSHDKNNPAYQGPVQFIDWLDWEMRFEKAVDTDKISGSFMSERGTFWIPGPASNSYAGLDLKFRMD